MAKTLPRICASVAGKASPLGVLIHDAAYRACGLDFKYIAVESEDLRGVVTALVTLNARGFALSMPHKAAVIGMLNEISDSVRAIGSCNTVVNESGHLYGHNTDWRGAVDALEVTGTRPPGKALIIGSGGVARALGYGLKYHGWEVSVCARNPETARELVDRFGFPSPLPYAAPPYRGFDLIVNATPSGDYPNGPCDLDWFPGAHALLDVVFIPVHTRLAETAKQRGWTVTPGWLMLLHQAAYQFRLYTGIEAPLDAMRETLLANLRTV